MKKPKITPIEESSFGVYVWQLPSGEVLGDTDGNILNIPSEKYDLSKIAIIRKSAAYYGYPEGEARFLSGRRRVTEEEYQEQKGRMAEGKTPDIYDAPALLDELAEREQNGAG